MNHLKKEIKNENINLSRLPERIYKEFYSKVDILYFLINDTYQIESCNVTAQERLGYSDVEILGKNFLDFFIDEQRSKVQDSIKKCFTKGFIRNCTSEIIGDLGIFPIKINGLSEINESGNPKFVRIYIQDISNTVYAKKERNLCLKLTNMIIKDEINKENIDEILIDLMDLYDSSEIGLVVNNNLMDNIFIKRSQLQEELQSQTEKDDYINWNNDIWRKIISSCLDTSLVNNSEKNTCITGKLSDLVLEVESEAIKNLLISLTNYESFIIHNLPDNMGYIVNLAGDKDKWNYQDVGFLEQILMFITNIITKLTDNTPKSDNINKSIFNSPLLGILCIKNDKIIFMNNWICEILGISQENLKERKIFDFIDEDSQNIILEMRNQKGTEKKICDITVILSDGGRCEIKCSISKYSHQGQTSELWYWINQGNERRLREQLIQAREMESLGILAGGIVHDFSNHLASILGFSSLLREEIPDDSPFYDDIMQITKSAERATDLSGRLLAYSKGNSYIINSLNVNQLIKEVAAILSRTLDNNKTIHAELSPDLNTIRADASQIQQAILQIALNSRDAIPGGGKIFFKTRNVELNENSAWKKFNAKPGKFVQIEISDNGHGISTDIKNRIFDPDFTTKNSDSGKGMGLAMVQDIIEKHSGFISVFSERNSGTVFKIHIPVQEKIKTKDETANDIKPTLGKETILLVDYEKIIRETARKMLNRYGYKVISAESGPEAIAIYKKYKSRIDIIILDMFIPGMKIKKILAWLKKINPDVKIISSTRIGDKDRIQSLYNKKVSGFIEKPFKVRPLLTKIRSVINN